MSDSRVFDLLAEWEEQRQQGKTLSAEELCPDDPALQDELRRRIRRQERVRGLIEPPKTDDTPSVVPDVEGYDILDVIGSGGMGIVYRARDRRLDRTVAVKMILAAGEADRHQLARFRDEARAVAALQHPNIVQVYETGEAAGRPYLVLEYVAGESLARHANGTPVGPRRAASLVAALAHAVQHAHDRGIIHRDLKPANILLAPDGTPKVTDFGLAKRLDSDSARTRTGVVVGSPSYMPPEQAAGNVRAVGPSTDVYALGAILYELLTGRPPFLGETILETIRQVTEHPPVAPTALQPGVPKDLEVICLKCLEKRPEDRFSSAAALAADLDRYLAGEPIHARPPSVLGILGRNLRRSNFHPGFRSYSNRMLLLAPFPFVVHFAVYAAYRNTPNFPVTITAVSLGFILLAQFILLSGNSTVSRFVPSGQRRHFVTVWAGQSIGVLSYWLVVRAVVPPDHPELMFLVYPLWMLQLGLTYLSFASEAGGLYVQGGLFYVLALALVFFLPWAPLIVGSLMTLNMLVSGLLLRYGLGLRSAPPNPGDPTADTVAP